jgi:hypothetical protein
MLVRMAGTEKVPASLPVSVQVTIGFRFVREVAVMVK